MAAWIQRLFLTVPVLSAATAWAQEADDPLEAWLAETPLAAPEPVRETVRLDAIDSEDFEVGAYVGLMSIEDFGVARVEGFGATYHISEDLFAEAFYARSTLGETSFERLSGGARLLTDSQRDFSQYGLLAGWNVLPGEAFVWDRWALATSFYLVGGAGASQFAGDQQLTFTWGAGYRVLASDWLALRFDVRDHMFESDLLGTNKLTHNLEVRTALSVFF